MIRQSYLSAFIAFFPCIHSEPACMTQRNKKKEKPEKVVFKQYREKALAPFEGLCFLFAFWGQCGYDLRASKSYQNEQTNISPITLFYVKRP